MNSKEQLKGNLMLSLESTNSRMSRNGKNELLLRKHRSLDEIIESVNTVTKENVDELIRNMFTDEFSAALISPDGKTSKRNKTVITIYDLKITVSLLNEIRLFFVGI